MKTQISEFPYMFFEGKESNSDKYIELHSVGFYHHQISSSVWKHEQTWPRFELK